MKTTLEIQNLKCGGCANTIKTRLEALEFISTVEVNDENDTVSFDYNTENELEEAQTLLHKLGYPVIGNINSLTTKAKSFVSCAVGRMNK